MGTVFRLMGDTIAPHPGTRLLRAEEYSRLLEAGELLAAARDRAEAIRAEAEEAYEARRREGYDDGVMEGRMEQAEKMMETAMQAVEYIENIEETLVGVVTSAVRKIIGELDEKERIVRVVRTALVAVRSQQKVLIRVCPADEAAGRSELSGRVRRSAHEAGRLHSGKRAGRGGRRSGNPAQGFGKRAVLKNQGELTWPSSISGNFSKRPCETSILWRRGGAWSRWSAQSSGQWCPG